MYRWTNRILVVVVALSLVSHSVRANESVYQDDDLLCRSGWSPDDYYQRLQQDAYQQRAAHAHYQRAIASEAAAEQKALENIQIARRARIEKESRRREETIARRKSENAVNDAIKSDANRTNSARLNAAVSQKPKGFLASH